MRIRNIVPLFLLAALASAPAVGAGEPGIHIHVAGHAFIVSVAPVDEESRDAENSVLYQRLERGGDWVELGPCRKETRPDGDVRFTREVKVDHDGVYHYTSRPVVGGTVERPPTAGSPAQALVVVDTLPPLAKITAPEEGRQALPGENVQVAWTSSDENLSPLPAALAYSTDGGRSWRRIGAELPSEGDISWHAPLDMSGPAIIRLAVVDLAGNTGRDAKSMEIEPVEPTVARAPIIPPELPPPPETPPVRDIASAPEPEPEQSLKDPNRAWLYYLMAINLMRQNKPADALQYYWLAVREDPDFIDAWADIGLAYIDLGAYRTARDVVEQTRDKAPDRIDLMHLLGETYHAEGMALLGEANTAEARMRAKGLIDQAVEWYGRALDAAAREWRLAEQAASFYRLGEVCYYVNMDRDGARAYWKKILELHSPTPNHDLVLWSRPGERESAKRRQQRYTFMRVSLESWQGWARGYLEQLDARERAGIMDLMPAQRITAVPAPQPLGYAGNALNPGRDDGRSLFSLPAQLGSPADEVAACVGYAPAAPVAAAPAPTHSVSDVAEGYSFYAPKAANRPVGVGGAAAGSRRGRDGAMFSGGPDQPPPPNPDPYAFPQRGRPAAPWNGTGAYGNEPVRDW